jgi:hypothetical protein
VRFETVAEIEGDGLPDADTTAPGISVQARVDAILADGRRLPVVDDRGWSEFVHGVHEIDVDPWTLQTAEGIGEGALMVAGPDEPVGDETHEDMEAWYWRGIAARLAEHGIDAGPEALAALPRSVVLGDALRAKLSPPPSAPRSAAT